MQCIDNDEFARSIPFFLSVNDIDKCISVLCGSKHFYEAWMIAKMRKDENDGVFEDIFAKWTQNMISNGSFEIAAALLCSKKCYANALEVLDMRKGTGEKHEQIYKLIASKVTKEG
jgi:hypothetical protein